MSVEPVAYKLFPASQIGQGKFFRKKQGSFAYLRLSAATVDKFNLDQNKVWGVSYNGNYTCVGPNTMVAAVPADVFLDNIGSEEDWNATFASPQINGERYYVGKGADPNNWLCCETREPAGEDIETYGNVILIHASSWPRDFMPTVFQPTVLYHMDGDWYLCDKSEWVEVNVKVDPRNSETLRWHTSGKASDGKFFCYFSDESEKIAYNGCRDLILCHEEFIARPKKEQLRSFLGQDNLCPNDIQALVRLIGEIIIG